MMNTATTSTKKPLLVPSERSLAIQYPLIAAQLHPLLNGELTAECVTVSSNKKLWWLGPCTHEWEARVFSRTKNGNNCPYCSGNKILIGFNDLATCEPELVLQWHAEKNAGVSPQNFTRFANTKVWWQCLVGHEWKAKISERTNPKRPSGCPKCGHREAVEGETDVASQLPKAALLWHPTKNKATPNQISIYYTKMLWWQCPLEHEWRGSLKGFINENKHGTCPFCTDRKLLVGFNDLPNRVPDLIEEWDHTANGIKQPEDYTPRSNEKVGWQCAKGHRWEASICSRAMDGKGCAKCCLRQTSKIEAELREGLRIRFADCYVSPDHSERILDNVKDKRQALQVDVIIREPSHRTVVVEYDGYFWHKNKVQQDLEKTQRLLATGVSVVRIREQGRTDQILPKLPLSHQNLRQLTYAYEKASTATKEELLVAVEASIRELWSSGII